MHQNNIVGFRIFDDCDSRRFSTKRGNALDLDGIGIPIWNAVAATHHQLTWLIYLNL